MEEKFPAAVAWRVKDFADGWIYFESSNKAYHEAEETGALIQPLFLDAALAQPQPRDASDGWKTIDSAPENGIPFDAWAIAGPGDNGFRVANCWTDESGVRVPAGVMFNPFCTITHWRPIPAAPSSSEPKLSDTPEGWQAEALHDVIVGALLEYCGTGQGVDDMLFDIASGQARGIIEAMRKFGHLQPLRDAPEGWRPIESAPKDGTDILLLCNFANSIEPIAAHWVDSPGPDGPFGKFTWRGWQDSAVAEQVPTHWMPIPPTPKRREKDENRS